MKKHDKTVLLAKSKLKALIDSYINHDEFVSVNNVLREYYETKVENPETSVNLLYYIKTIETYCVSCKKTYC